MVVFRCTQRVRGAGWTTSSCRWEGSQSRWLAPSFSERTPTFSPDGRWIAYRFDETGREEVYVRAYPGPRWTHTYFPSQGAWNQSGPVTAGSSFIGNRTVS